MPKAPLHPRTKTVTATTTDDGFTDIFLCNGTFTLTLAVGTSKRKVDVVNIGSGTVTVASASGSVLGVSSLAGQYTAAEYVWDGTNWYARASTSGANAFALNGVTAGTAAASKAVVLDASKIISGMQFPAVARTATTDGTTTGTIADAGGLQHVTVTCDDANKIIVLPTPTPGTIVVLHNGATGYELRSSAPATVAINAGTGSAAESAIAANSTCVMICVTATAWKGFFLDADSDVAKVEAAAP